MGLQALVTRSENMHPLCNHFDNLSSKQQAAIERSEEAREREEKRAHESLRAELVAAFDIGGEAKVRTPGFHGGTDTLSTVFGDFLAGKDCDAQWDELCKILGLAAKSGGDVGLRASAFIAQFGQRHADFHVADLLGA
jgi:hypothetical protein